MRASRKNRDAMTVPTSASIVPPLGRSVGARIGPPRGPRYELRGIRCRGPDDEPADRGTHGVRSQLRDTASSGTPRVAIAIARWCRALGPGPPNDRAPRGGGNLAVIGVTRVARGHITCWNQAAIRTC